MTGDQVDTAPRVREIDVKGFAHEEFAPLNYILPRLAPLDAGRGSSLAICKYGELVVDLACGDYDLDSRQLQFSVSKAVTAIAAQHAAAAGRLDLDEPLAVHWPAFDRTDSRAITTRMVLSHTAGLPGVDEKMTVHDIIEGRYLAALERQQPYWEPGTRHGYHAFSFGPLMDGVFQHVLGTSVGAYVAQHLAAPLSSGLTYGLSHSDVEGCRPFRRPRRASTPFQRHVASTSGFEDKGSRDLSADSELFNRPEVQAQGWPNSNVVSSARDMARLLASTCWPVDGFRSLDDHSVRELTKQIASGPDAVLGIHIAFGSGVQRPFPQLPFTGPSCFGHEGAGGCVAFVDPPRGLAVAFNTDAYPACDGAAVSALALFPTIQMLHDGSAASQLGVLA